MEDLHSWYQKFKPCAYSNKLLNKLSDLNSITPNKIDLNEVKKAIYYAKKYHGRQTRDSGEPYYSHPIEVACMTADYLQRTDIIVTSILHDTIEDTELTFDMIKVIFNEVIACQVMDLTRVKENGHKINSSKMLELLWNEKKYDVLLVKLIDRLHNLQTIQAKPIEKIKKIVNETLRSFIVFAIYIQHTSLAQVMCQLCCNALSIEMTPYRLSQTTMDVSHLFYLKESDTHQLVSQVFQNVIHPARS